MATGVRAVVAATSLTIAMLLAAALVDAIAVGDTCPCALSGGGGRCLDFQLGSSPGTCSIRPCKPSYNVNGDCGDDKVCVSGTCEAAGDCEGGKEQACDIAYTLFTEDKNNRAKCCPANSQCVKTGIQGGESTACSTDCGKNCAPFCSFSGAAAGGLPLCSEGP
ncbi:hypothetical protein I4F81_004559 [Pyropia yezoensis]|uniref:Uncharacterized protein n=1 Tax=Pyropia yezoensis TaxID=2788 RepID=A0ACC3BVR0_PYRYE|nr:hypothetical protein I4F81_004559 [Neopyropia yezoensis]